MAKKKKTRAKRRVIGALGKLGVVIMATGPPVGSAVSAFKEASAPILDGIADPTMGSRFEHAFNVFINNLSNGFGFGNVFPNTRIQQVSGGSIKIINARSNLESGVWWKVEGVGGVILGVDRLIAFALKRPVKLPGTNITLTGN